MTTVAPIIHVVDDDDSFRQSIGRMLESSGFRVVLYDSGQKILEQPLADDAGCILLDVRMPDLSGQELHTRLVEKGNSLPIIFLTGYGDIPMTVRAIQSGAIDFLPKPVLRKNLIESIQRALNHYEKTRVRQRRLDLLKALVRRLTPRENEVFALIVQGKQSKQIAHELGTSERTIKAHRQAVMDKLEVQSLAEATSIAERLGMLADEHDRK